MTVAFSLTALDTRAVTVAVVTPPSHGALTGSGPAWTYTPSAEYAGDDSAVVMAADDQGSDTATVHFVVTPVNDAPVAGADSLATGFETKLSVAQATLLANDSDVEGATLTLTEVSAAVHGTVELRGSDVVFTPERGFQGAASFTYTVSDGALTATGSVAIAIGVDQPPVAAGDVSTVTEGSVAATLDVLGNDSDAGRGPRAVASVTQPAHGTAAVSADGGAVLYTPNPGYCNQTPNMARDTFSYTLAPGGSAASVAVSVTCACGVHHATDFIVGSN